MSIVNDYYCDHRGTKCVPQRDPAGNAFILEVCECGLSRIHTTLSSGDKGFALIPVDDDGLIVWSSPCEIAG